MSFETDRIDDCIKFMKELKLKQQALNGSKPGELCLMATGGGAFKFYDKIKEALGVDIVREDEMECLIIGMYLQFRIYDILLMRLLQVLISSLLKYLARSSLTAKPTQCNSPRHVPTYTHICLLILVRVYL